MRSVTNIRQFYVVSVANLLLLLTAAATPAAVVNWLPQTSGLWDTPQNWSGMVLPGPADEVFIDPTTAVNVAGPANHQRMKTLAIGGTGFGRVSLQLSGAMRGDLRVDEYAELHHNGELVLADDRILSTGIIFYNSGVVRGTGTLDASLLNFELGQVRASTGQSLVVSGGGTNFGKMEALGGSLEFLGHLTNVVDKGLITGRDATLRFRDGLTNEASLALTAGVNDVTGDIENKMDASIVVSGGAAATFHDDVVQDGLLRVSKVGSTTSTAVFLGGFTGAGGSTGGGDIFFEGDLRPGNSPATVSFENNVSLGSTSNLKIELGGTAEGSQYDQIRVIGQLSLGGRLQVSLINGFAPAASNMFNILDWTSRVGTFAQVQLPPLAGALAWNDTQLYSDGLLSIVPTFLAGDFNRDGLVTTADIPAMLAALTNLNSYKSTNSLSDANLLAIGNLNGDTHISNADIQSLLNLLSGGGGVAAVPEPASWIGAAVGLALAAIRWRCRNRSTLSP